MKKAIRVRVPATTANVGPGFDTLGIALKLYNEIDLTLSEIPRVELLGEIPVNQNHGAMKMIMGASRSFFRKIQSEEKGLTIRIRGDIPMSRGLGSSVTIRLGIVAGLNQLCDSPLKKNEVLDLVAELEGHPDNAAPAMLGGFVVSGIVDHQVVYLHKKLPKTLRFVAAIPEFEVETKKSRSLLPSTLPFTDAAHNVNRVALLVAAFWSGDYQTIGSFLEDRLHQPYRAKLIPQLFPVLNAAKLAGAIGGWLSGSGSTMMALTLSNAKKVGEAMQKAFRQSGGSCHCLILEVDNEGVRLK